MNTVNKYSVFRIILSTQIGDEKPYCYDGSRVDPSWLLGGLSKVSMCWLLVMTEVCIAKFESHREFWLLPPKESLCIQTFLSRSESPDLPFTLEVYETLYVEVYVSLPLCVQNAVPAQPCVGKLGISLVLLNFLHCNFRLWFKTP